MKKKYITLWLVIFIVMLPLAFAAMDQMEDSGVSTQFNELQPFSHLSEGHWFAFILSLILWLSLIYAIYSIFKMLMKKK